MSIHDDLLEMEPEVRTDHLRLGILDDMISYQLRRAQLRVFHSFTEHLEDAKVTPGQLALLIKISNNPAISQTALARANGIERSTLGEIVDRFEKRGWVVRRKHSTDRRAYALHLTTEGALLVDALVPSVMDHETELTRGWPEGDRSTLLRLLRRLAAP
ncbi:MarR family winged helix-turn-helix transcriptional regulator [Gilvimarinus sp. F26214L]|uniref:MarR family winged helix-turn-helix transcriptional regulator n=1 Tax=Gilvimarinus sp. DZF01 TaxID=3461371 RepID=UPI0040455A84